MRARLYWVAVAVVILVPASLALAAWQRGGGGSLTGAGALPEGMVGEGVRQETPFEQFSQKLKLDEKTHVPAAREILLAAAQEGGPVGMQLLQIRQRMLNVALSDKPDDMKAAMDAYTEAATKMMAIEAAAFQKVCAILKPNQQTNAAQAFTILAGLLQAPAPATGRGGGQRRGGQQ
jgi:hypothetical protein